MYYSVTFTDTSGVKKNTWTDWHLIPSSPPFVEPPEVYTNYVEIPGRAAGPIDLSEALTGAPSYKNSEGSWSFIAEEGHYSRPVLYQMLKRFLHGKVMKIELEEDPLHFYRGRISLGELSVGKSNTGFTLNYEIAPVRYALDGTAEGF